MNRYNNKFEQLKSMGGKTKKNTITPTTKPYVADGSDEKWVASICKKVQPAITVDQVYGMIEKGKKHGLEFKYIATSEYCGPIEPYIELLTLEGQVKEVPESETPRMVKRV